MGSTGTGSKLILQFNAQNIKQAANVPVVTPAEAANLDQFREPLLEDQPKINYGAF